MLKGQLHSIGIDPSTVLLEDGRSLQLEYEVLDPSGTLHLDQVRVEVTTSGEVTTLLPLRSVAEAAAILERASVLTVSPEGEANEPWTAAIFEQAWSTPGEAVACFDGHYLEASTIEDWLRRSGLATVSIAPGPMRHGEPSVVIDTGAGPRTPVRPVARDLVWEVNAIAAEADGTYRWYGLPTEDARGVYLRLDRETAAALGLGVFAASDS